MDLWIRLTVNLYLDIISFLKGKKLLKLLNSLVYTIMRKRDVDTIKVLYDIDFSSLAR